MKNDILLYTNWDSMSQQTCITSSHDLQLTEVLKVYYPNQKNSHKSNGNKSKNTKKHHKKLNL